MKKLVFILSVVGVTTLGIFKLSQSWYFRGYSTSEGIEPVERNGFQSETKCVNFGDEWLPKQKGSDAFFTCSLDCKSDEYGAVCDKICKYSKSGFISCRD